MMRWNESWNKMNGNGRSEQKALLHALGLCARAGKLLCGVPMICEALSQNRKPFLVLCASDNAENSAKRLRDRCDFYGVRLENAKTDGETLAHAVGKTGRLAAVAVTDAQLCRLVENHLPALKTMPIQ